MLLALKKVLDKSDLHNLVHLDLSLEAGGGLASEVLVTFISLKPGLATNSRERSRGGSVLPRLFKCTMLSGQEVR
jgi:hypothetical protein